MGEVIGIDFGLDHTVVAYVGADGKPRVLVNKYMKEKTSNVVGLRTIKGGTKEILVGDAALDNNKRAPKDTIFAIRDLLGRNLDDPIVKKVAERYDYEIVERVAYRDEQVIVEMSGSENVGVMLGDSIYSPEELLIY